MGYPISPYKKYVPSWLKVASLLLLIFLHSFVSGIGDITALPIAYLFGIEKPTAILFMQFSAIGTVAIYPIVYRFRSFFRRIHLLFIVLSLEIIISLSCAKTGNTTILLASGIFMGLLKIICTVEFISLLINEFPFMSNRPLFYGFYYCISKIFQEITIYINLYVIDKYDWTFIFVISAISASLCIIICALLFHKERMQRKVPLYQVDWISMFLVIILGMSLCYVFTMGLTKNWFNSKSISFSVLIFLASTSFFIYRQFKVKRPFWDLRVFKIYKQIPLGLILMVIMYFFYLTSTLFSQYVEYNFHGEYSYLRNIRLINVVSYCFSFPLAGILLYRGRSVRFILSVGFLCYAFSLFYLSYIVQTSLSFNNLIIPIFLQGVAFGFCLTTLSSFMASNISINQNKNRAMGSIMSRYIIASFVGYSLYSNWMFKETVRHHTYLAESLTYDNFSFMNELKKGTAGFISKGLDPQAAQNMALGTFEKRIDLQSMLISIKDIAFIEGILAVTIAIFILFIRLLEIHNQKNKYRIVPW